MDEHDADLERVNQLLERSSLGTPGAQQLRRRTPPEQVAAVRRIAQLRNRIVHAQDGDAAAAAATELAGFLTELGYREQADHLLYELGLTMLSAQRRGAVADEVAEPVDEVSGRPTRGSDGVRRVRVVREKEHVGAPALGPPGDLPIGRRVAYWRGRRKMSQEVFAGRLGKSKTWVDKVERGVRRLDKFSVVHEIADVLQVDVQLLLGKYVEGRPETQDRIDQVEVEEIRAALERYNQMSAFVRPVPQAPPLAEIRKAVSHVWLTYQHAKYGVLARMLPQLLRDAQAADLALADGVEAKDAAHLLSQVYQVTSSLLRKVGEHELAWLAADRSVAVAQRAGDQLLTGIAIHRVGMALLSLGRVRPALEANLNVANLLAPLTSDSATPEQLSVYGLLLLTGALAAARIGDAATVRDLISGAEQAADALGGDYNHYWTSFGPTNVELHRAAAAVELGDGNKAIETHTRIDATAFATMLPERRAQHYLDIARAYTQVGNVEKAGEMLLEGDRLAPSEIRCRPLAHDVLSDVLRRTRGTPPTPITELAEEMGVGV